MYETISGQTESAVFGDPGRCGDFFGRSGGGVSLCKEPLSRGRSRPGGAGAPGIPAEQQIETTVELLMFF